MLALSRQQVRCACQELLTSAINVFIINASSDPWSPAMLGHDHIYERTCSIYNFTCMPDNTDGTQGGITHVVGWHTAPLLLRRRDVLMILNCLLSRLKFVSVVLDFQLSVLPCTRTYSRRCPRR